jgi:mono/diheme cytochrome c family protein
MRRARRPISARICLMPKPSQPARRLRLILFVSALALIVVSVGFAVFETRPLIVPLPDRQRQNPLVDTEANLTAAKRIYSDKCSNCHGDTGKGDGSDAMMYDPTPSDLTDAARISKLTDGEIFYQITEGRKPMPSFRKKLTEEQRWQLVLLVRWFAKQPAKAVGTADQTPTANQQVK